jgi:hypothetical protein
VNLCLCTWTEKASRERWVDNDFLPGLHSWRQSCKRECQECNHGVVLYSASCCYAQVTIRPRDGKKVEHNGIKIEFVGSIGAFISHYNGVSDINTNGLANTSCVNQTSLKVVTKQPSSWHYLKNWLLLVIWDRLPALILNSRTLKNNTNAIMELMPSWGMSMCIFA